MDVVEKSMESAHKTSREMKALIKQGEAVLAKYEAELAKLGHTSESLSEYVLKQLPAHERLRYQKEGEDAIASLRSEIEHEVNAMALYTFDLSPRPAAVPASRLSARKLSRSFV